MKRSALLVLMILFSVSLVWADVIISQYYEGSSNNKWIEVTNVGGTAIDLTDPQLYLCLFANAAADNPSTNSPNNNYPLTGTVNAGGVLVFRTSTAALPSYATGTSTTVCNFNGDDTVIISTSNGSSAWNDRIDAIGDGSSWGGNTSFYRNSAIVTSNTSYTSAEWAQVTNAAVDGAINGDSQYLGTHVYTTGTPNPTITLSETALTDFTYLVGGGPSTEQSFTVAGVNLTANISIAATSNYEISTDTDGAFSATNPITLTQSGGDVATTTIYTRLKAGLIVGDYNGEDITATSGLAPAKLVTCSGSVTDGSTLQEPAVGDLIITEVCGDGAGGGSDDGFMEIYNTTSNILSLANIQARYFNNGAESPTQIVNLSGTIAPGAYVIVTQNETNFNITYSPITADFSGSLFYFNGGTDGADIYDNSARAGVLDSFNDNGLDASPWSWNDDYTFERTSTGSGGVVTNWTEITSGIGTPGADNDNALPVTLTSFTAVQFQNDMATIRWETASESNMSCFRIYRDQMEITSVAASNTSETHTYSVHDQDLEAGQTYNYYLEAVEYDGSTETYGPIVLSVNEDVDPEDPPSANIEASILMGNFPNPFNPTTVIKFNIDEEETGILEIYSARGQLLETAEYGTGEHEFNWNANNHASGVYFYKLRTESYSETKKMILLK